MAAENEGGSRIRKVFFAIDIPQGVGSALYSVAREFEEHGVPIMSPDKYHITLHHLKGIEEERMDDVLGALSYVEKGRFTVTLSGLSYFGKGSVEVVFADAVAARRGIESLRNDVLKGLTRNGIAYSADYPFRHHVTLALPNGNFDDGLLKGIIESHRSTKFGSFEVDGVALKESIRGAGGHVHRTLRKVML